MSEGGIHGSRFYSVSFTWMNHFIFSANTWNSLTPWTLNEPSIDVQNLWLTSWILYGQKVKLHSTSLSYALRDLAVTFRTLCKCSTSEKKQSSNSASLPHNDATWVTWQEWHNDITLSVTFASLLLPHLLSLLPSLHCPKMKHILPPLLLPFPSIMVFGTPPTSTLNTLDMSRDLSLGGILRESLIFKKMTRVTMSLAWGYSCDKKEC